jgi:hypothetical protein
VEVRLQGVCFHIEKRIEVSFSHFCSAFSSPSKQQQAYRKKELIVPVGLSKLFRKETVPTKLNQLLIPDLIKSLFNFQLLFIK